MRLGAVAMVVDWSSAPGGVLPDALDLLELLGSGLESLRKRGKPENAREG